MMKVKAALIATLTTLLLSGQTVDLSKVYFQPSGNYSADILQLGELHKETTAHFHDLHDALLDDSGMISMADTIDQMTVNEANRTPYKQKCEAWSNQLLVALDLSNKALISTVNFNAFLNSLQTTGARAAEDTIHSQELVTILTVGVLGGVAAYKFLEKVMGAVDKSQNIVNDVAANNEADRSKVVEILKTNNVQVSGDATPQEIRTTFKTLNMGTRQHIVNAVRGHVVNEVIDNTADNSYVTISEKDKKAIFNAQVELSGVAVEGTVFAYTSVTGSLGGLLTNKYLGAGLDLTTGLTQTDPLALLGRTLRVTANSQVTDTIPMPVSTVSNDEVFRILAELEVNGIDNVTFNELDNAKNSYGSLLASRDGDGDDLTLSYPRYTFFQDIPLTQDTIDPDTWLGKVKIPASLYDYLFDFTITSLDGLLKILRNIRPGDVLDIQLQKIGNIVCLKSEKKVGGICEPMNCEDDGYNCPDCTGDYIFWDYKGNSHCISTLATEFAYPELCPASPTVPGETIELFMTPDGWDVRCEYFPQDNPDFPGKLVWELDYGALETKSVFYWWDTVLPLTIEYELTENIDDPSIINPELKFNFCTNKKLLFANSKWDGYDHGTTATYYQPVPGTCSDQPTSITNYTNNVKDGNEMIFDNSGVMTSCTIWVNGTNSGSCL